MTERDVGFLRRAMRLAMNGRGTSEPNPSVGCVIVKDGVVQKMFIEPQKPGDPFEVSDADTLLAYINPNAKKPDQVAIFTREGCQFCTKAKALLTEMGYDYAEIPLAHTQRSRIVGAVTGESTVPQVFINGERIGGLEALERRARKAA